MIGSWLWLSWHLFYLQQHFKGLKMHNDKLLNLVIEQVLQDINDGDVTAIFDMLDMVDRERLINYLSPSLLKQAVKYAIVTQDEIDDLLVEF